MLDPLPHRVLTSVRRIGHLDRRSPRAFGRWIEQTSNLLHLPVLLFVPLLIVVVTTLANTVESLSFLQAEQAECLGA